MDINRLKKGYAKWVANATAAISFAESFLIISLCVYFELQNPHPIVTSFAIIFSGWFIWIFIEYLVHRFVFHFKTKNKYLLFIRYLFHGVHHHQPAKSLFVPILIRMAVQLIVFLLFVLLFKEYAILFYLGIVLGVVHYITIHYCLHHSKWSAYFPRLKKYHYIHHYLEPESCFGTTSLLWDRVFGTFPKQEFTELTYDKKIHFI